MAIRAAHGKSRRLGAVVAVETLPADELPAAEGSDPGRPDRDAAGRFLPGNSLARNARYRSGAQGELSRLEAKGDPAWRASDRWSKQWSSFRRAELTSLHGGSLSSEVCALIEDARQAMADARWARAKAAECESEGDVERATSLRSDARQLRIEARGHRLAAWEIAAKEAEARGKSERTGVGRRLIRPKQTDVQATAEPAKGDADS